MRSYSSNFCDELQAEWQPQTPTEMALLEKMPPVSSGTVAFYSGGIAPAAQTYLWIYICMS
jgi:hypothetical protein